MNGSGIARPAEEAGKRLWETKNRYRGLSSRQVRVVSFFLPLPYQWPLAPQYQTQAQQAIHITYLLLRNTD
jgi:hypothetical protein